MENSDIRTIKFENNHFEVATGFKFSMSPFIINNQYEPWIVKYAKVILKDLQKPIIFDIGANVGLITLPISQINKESQVYSFEALPPCAKVLENNIKRNNIQNVQVINKAVSSTSKNLLIHLAMGHVGESFTSTLQDNDIISYGGFKVEAITIDDFVKTNNIKKIDLMKIDVEGWEEHALVGAEESIKKFKPCCIIEFNVTRMTEDSESTAYSLYNKLQTLFDKIFLIDRLYQNLFEVNNFAELRSLMLTGHNVEDLLCMNTSNFYEKINAHIVPKKYACYGSASIIKQSSGLLSFLSCYPDGWTNGRSAAIISGLNKKITLSVECYWIPEHKGEQNYAIIYSSYGVKKWKITDDVKKYDLDIEENGIVYIWSSKSRSARIVFNNQDPREIGFNMKIIGMVD